MFEISQIILRQSLPISTYFHLRKQESRFPVGISIPELAAGRLAGVVLGEMRGKTMRASCYSYSLWILLEIGIGLIFRRAA